MSRLSRWGMIASLVLMMALAACQQNKPDTLAEEPTPANGSVILEEPTQGGEVDVAGIEPTATAAGDSGGVNSEGNLANGPTPTAGGGAATSTPAAEMPSTPSAGDNTGISLMTPEAQATTVAVEEVPTPGVVPTVAPSQGDATAQGMTSTPGAYTVVAGDTLYSVALKHNTTVEQLRALNSLTTDYIFVGQQLKVPGSTTAAPAPAPTGSGGATVYTVKVGDWLYKIARENGVTPEAIQRANPGVNLTTVYPGQQLNIPRP